MTDARRKAKIWLLQQEKTFADIASISRLSEATIHNALDGRGSARTKQAITNALGTQLWDDVPVTERFITFRPGISIEFPDVRMAHECINELSPDTARQRGRTLTFTKPCTFVVEIKGAKRPARMQNGKRLRQNKELRRT